MGSGHFHIFKRLFGKWLSMKILVTGGAGYIASTIATALLDRGDEPILLDSLVSGVREYTNGRIFYEGDISDGAVVDRIFSDHPDIYAVVHCAALIDSPASVREPALYYDYNIVRSLAFFNSVLRNGCHRIVFSSSASIYESASELKIDETRPVGPLSPYGRTKAMSEEILRDLSNATALRTISLRYFNPIGADPELRTGPHHRDASHVLGRLFAAARQNVKFTITGTDFDTPDGTGIRDYIHVWDLASAHLHALDAFDEVTEVVPFRAINVGRGEGVSVRELTNIFNTIIHRPIPIHEGPRRDGDGPGGFAACELAASLLGWKSQLSIAQAITDALRWLDTRESNLGY